MINKPKKGLIQQEILEYIKKNSNSKGECTLTDQQIGIGLYGTYDEKTKVKITSCILRLKKKDFIESKYSRIIFVNHD